MCQIHLRYISNISKGFYKKRQNDAPASGSMLKMCLDLLFARQSLLVKHNVHTYDMSYSYTYPTLPGPEHFYQQ